MAKVDDLLKLETDGSCANCGWHDARALTVHHIEQAEPKNEAYDNKLLLCHNCHQCHHQGKGPTADELRDVKRRLIVKTLTRPGLNALKEAYRHSMVVAMPFLVNHLIEFGYLEYIEWVMSETSDEGEEIVSQAKYKISASGRALLESWGLK